MDESEKKKIFEIMLDMLDLMHRIAKLVGIRENLVDVLIEYKEKREKKEIENKNQKDNIKKDNIKFDRIEKAIIKVNEKDYEIEKLANDIINSENKFKDKNKIKALLKAIAICKIAGISEHRLSLMMKENEELRNKIGNFGNIRSIYHAMKYTAVWGYRNDVYKIFNLKADKNETIKCPYCGSTDVIKQGGRKTRKGRKQRYYCKSCNKSFVLHRDKNIITYDKKWRDIAGKLYCNLGRNLLLKDVIKIMQNDYKLNVSSATVSNWINDFIRENLGRLTQAQKNMLVIKKVIELNGKSVTEIADIIKRKWNYRITHTKLIELIFSYNKVKKNEDKIKMMIEEGKELYVISEIFGVNKDMLVMLYGEKQ